MPNPFTPNTNPLVGYTEGAYDDESLYWKALQANELELWDWKHAHKTPPPLKPSDFDLRCTVRSYNRYRTWDAPSGFKIHMNTSQIKQPDKQVPYLGQNMTEGDVWMAFFPVTQRPGGDVFLSAYMISNYSLNQYITQTSPGQYRLDATIVEAWYNIERSVAAIAPALRPLLDFPLPVAAPISPSHHGYSKAYPSHELAFEACRKARTAWKYLAAYTAFLLSFWNRESDLNTMDLLVSWLADTRGLNKKWLMMLVRFSQLADFKAIGRLGLDIAYDSPWIPFLPIFLQCGIPVTFLIGCGPDEDTIRSEPMWDLVGYVYEGAIPVHSSDCTCGKCPQYDGMHLHLPILCPQEFVDSRQREWLRYCFDTRTSTKKRVGGAAVDSIAKYIPALERWTVYEWMVLDGVSHRCMVAPEAASNVFNFYEIRQRFFSPLYFEVDLCFDPPTPTAGVGLAEGTSDDATPAADDIPLTLGEDDEDDDLDEDDPPTVPVTLDATPSSTSPGWKEVLRLRLGFDVGNTYAAAEVAAVDDGKVKRGLQVTGFQPLSCFSQMSLADKSYLMVPIRSLCAKDVSLDSLPVQFDLASRDLVDSLSRFQIQPIHQVHGSVTIRRFVIGIHGSSLRSQWFVLVVESHVLLEIARRGWNSLRQIARSLALQGTEFHTARLYDPKKVTPVMSYASRTGLGTLRPDKEPFTAEDYELYERGRDSFLRSGRGHLALAMGGFPARMARDVVDIKSVYVRPFQDPNNGRVLGTTRDGLLVICDYVTHAELDRLLGRYSRIVSGIQDTVTLWPPMSVWEVMGNNTECWNEAAEFWFQGRLGQCRSSNPIELRSVGAWRKKCRLVKETRDLWKAYRKLAGDYLEANLHASTTFDQRR